MPQLDFFNYFTQFIYFYLFFVVLYFFLVLCVLPALVRNLKFRGKVISRLEKSNTAYALMLNKGDVFPSFLVIFRNLGTRLNKLSVRFSLLGSFLYTYVSSGKEFVELNDELQDSFSDLMVKRSIITKSKK